MKRQFSRSRTVTRTDSLLSFGGCLAWGFLLLPYSSFTVSAGNGSTRSPLCGSAPGSIEGAGSPLIAPHAGKRYGWAYNTAEAEAVKGNRSIQRRHRLRPRHRSRTCPCDSRLPGVPASRTRTDGTPAGTKGGSVMGRPIRTERSSWPMHKRDRQ